MSILSLILVLIGVFVLCAAYAFRRVRYDVKKLYGEAKNELIFSLAVLGNLLEEAPLSEEEHVQLLEKLLPQFLDSHELFRVTLLGLYYKDYAYIDVPDNSDNQREEAVLSELLKEKKILKEEAEQIAKQARMVAALEKAIAENDESQDAQFFSDFVNTIPQYYSTMGTVVKRLAEQDECEA